VGGLEKKRPFSRGFIGKRRTKVTGISTDPKEQRYLSQHTKKRSHCGMFGEKKTFFRDEEGEKRRYWKWEA